MNEASFPQLEVLMLAPVGHSDLETPDTSLSAGLAENGAQLAEN